MNPQVAASADEVTLKELDVTTPPAAPRCLDPDRLGDHVDRLYRVARAMCGSADEAEDLVQDTFARVLRKPRFLHSEDDIGYLLRVLKNTFVSNRRRARRRPQTAPLLEELVSVEDWSTGEPEQRIDSAELYQAISSLPDPFRDALIAVDVIGLSYREASSALGVREATITSRLHRARQRVADALGSDTARAPTAPSRPAALAALCG